MDITTLAPYLAGPGAGLLVCFLVGSGLYKFATNKIMPLIEGTVNRHLQQIDSMNERHSTEHQAILNRCQSDKGEILGAIYELREDIRSSSSGVPNGRATHL